MPTTTVPAASANATFVVGYHPAAIEPNPAPASSTITHPAMTAVLTRLRRRLLNGSPMPCAGVTGPYGNLSPRGSVYLMQLSKAFAAMEGRDFLLPDDVKRAAAPVFRHRLVLKPEADLDGLSADQVTADVLAAVEVPK